MRSPYTVLGVPESAEPQTIKSAYRILAKTWHPDQNRDNPEAGPRFAEITQAYQLLIDPDKRARFDRGEIDGFGRRRTRPATPGGAKAFSTFREAWRRRPTAAGQRSAGYDDLAGFDAMVKHIFGDDADASDCGNAGAGGTASTDPLSALDHLFARWKSIHREPGEAARRKARGKAEIRRMVGISFDTAMNGGKAAVQLDDGQAVSVPVPAGTLDGSELCQDIEHDGQTRQLRVTVRLEPKSGFRCDGHHLHMDAAVELQDAVLGGSVVVQSVDGPVKVKLSEWSSGHLPVRIAGRGLPSASGDRGDLFVHLHIRLPQARDEAIVDAMRSRRQAWYV